MSDTDNEPGKLEIRGRTNGPTIKDSTLIIFDQPVYNLSKPDLLSIRASDGSEITDLTLDNARGQPPRVNYATARGHINIQFQLERIDDRTWRIQFEPHHKEIM